MIGVLFFRGERSVIFFIFIFIFFVFLEANGIVECLIGADINLSLQKITIELTDLFNLHG